MRRINFTLLFLVMIILFGLLGAFATIMISFNQNEHMYIAASVLVAQDKIIYRDFAYVQTPYLPLFYGTLYKLLHINSYYLLTGKVISFLAFCISATTVYIVARRALKDTELSLGVTTLFILNTSIVGPAIEVSNYIMPVAFLLVGFHLFNVSNEKNIKLFGVAIAGLLLAIATGLKLTSATAIIPFVGIILFSSLIYKKSLIPSKRSTIYLLFSFVSGIVVGLLPMFFYLSDVEAFIFNNLEYHNINTQWRQITGYPGSMSLWSKITYARDIFFQANNLILLLGVLLGFGLFINKSSQTSLQTFEREIPTGAFLALLLFLTAIPTALSPTPSFSQYFIWPISCLFLLLIYSNALQSFETLTLRRRLLLILVSVSVIYNGPLLSNYIYHLTDRNAWQGIYVHDVSMNIRKALLVNGIDTNRKIATLSPIYVIEANLPIYLELSTGQFTYRSGDLLTSEQREHFVVTSPDSIQNLFSKDKPLAILTGFEGKLDEPFVKYAKTYGYEKVEGISGGGKLFILNVHTP
jgi:hypothetical protein